MSLRYGYLKIIYLRQDKKLKVIDCTLLIQWLNLLRNLNHYFETWGIMMIWFLKHLLLCAFIINCIKPEAVSAISTERPVQNILRQLNWLSVIAVHTKHSNTALHWLASAKSLTYWALHSTDFTFAPVNRIKNETRPTVVLVSIIC